MASSKVVDRFRLVETSERLIRRSAMDDFVFLIFSIVVITRIIIKVYC